jgi:chromosome segregation ATPase
MRIEIRIMKVSQEMREAIIRAADDLFAKGNARPTNEQVRAELGKGSLSHISPIMKEWRESKKADENAAFELPDSLRKAVQDAINRMWVTATNLANDSVEAYRREADKAVQDADQERDEALNEVGRLEVIVGDLEKALSAQAHKVEQLEARLGQEQSRSSELLAEKASMEADLAGRKEQIERLHNDIDVVRQDYRALQSELIQMAKAGKSSFEE